MTKKTTESTIQQIPFGTRAKCRISGFTGIVTGRAYHKYGCNDVLLSADRLGSDGEPTKSCWFQEHRIEWGESPEGKAVGSPVDDNHSPVDLTKLGSVYRDEITGCEGAVISICQYINGSNNLTIRSKTVRDQNGQPVEWTFDEGALVLVENKPVVNNAPAVRNGGPYPKPSLPKTRRVD